MGLKDRLRIGRKGSAAGVNAYGSLREMLQMISGIGSDGMKGYAAQISDGYASNPYVLKCVDLRATAVSSLTPVLYDSDGN